MEWEGSIKVNEGFEEDWEGAEGSEGVGDGVFRFGV